MIQKIDQKTWVENSMEVKEFIDQNPDYVQLSSEVAHILETIVKKAEIEYSSITHRAKSLHSFLEKIVRKKYDEPFKEITDFAGVRLVFLYNSDFYKIESIIKENFKIIEIVDKLNDKGVDKFGYGAIHFIVQLSSSHSGARYDNIKNLKCEIQVRTVLQDAWSIIDHHLAYKNESAIPKQLRRQINGLAGLFETADNSFNQIRKERELYISKVIKSKEKPQVFLNEDLNLDSLREYAAWKFPHDSVEVYEGQIQLFLKVFKNHLGYSKLIEIDNLVVKGIDKYNSIKHNFIGQKFNSSLVALAITMAFGDPEVKWKLYQHFNWIPV